MSAENSDLRLVALGERKHTYIKPARLYRSKIWKYAGHARAVEWCVEVVSQLMSYVGQWEGLRYVSSDKGKQKYQQ